MRSSITSFWARIAVGVALVSLAPLAKADGESLPQPSIGGAGNFAVGATSVDASNGAATSTYPFILPDARGSAQVDLRLAYRSDRADSDAGKGWGLSLPVIERRRSSNLPNLNQAGGEYLMHPRFPTAYDDFVWNGQPLVEICTIQNGACANGVDQSFRPAVNGWKYYRLQKEGEDSFVRFFHLEDWDPMHAHIDLGWQVEYKNGTIEKYGSDGLPESTDRIEPTDQGDLRGAAVTNGAVPVRWNLTQRADSHTDNGSPINFVTYRWWRPHPFGRSLLSDIWYTPHADSSKRTDTKHAAHHVRLEWEAHDFPFPHFAPMDKAVPDMRLKRVDIASHLDTSPGSQQQPRTLIRRYRLTYYVQGFDAPQRNHSFLKSIEMEGASGVTEAGLNDEHVAENTNGQRLPPTTFTYTQLTNTPKKGFFAPVAVDQIYAAPVPTPQLGGAGVIDLNRDGLPDFIVTTYHNDADLEYVYSALVQTGQSYSLRHECADQPPWALLGGNGISVTGLWGRDNPGGLLWTEHAPSGYMLGVHRSKFSPEAPGHSLCHLSLALGLNRQGWKFQNVAPTFNLGDPSFPQGCPSFAPSGAFPACWGFRHPVDANTDGLSDFYVQNVPNPDWDPAAQWPVNQGHQQVLFSYRLGTSIVPLAERVRSNIAIRKKRAHFSFADINGDGVPDIVAGKEPGDAYGYPANAITTYVPGYGDGAFEASGRFSSLPANGYATLDKDIVYNVGPNVANGYVPGAGNVQAIVLKSAPNLGWNDLPAPPAGPAGIGDYRYPSFVDLNGDGLADAVVPIYKETTNTVILSIWFNLDGQHFEHYCFGQPTNCPVDDGLEISFSGVADYRLAFADVDASGTTDIVVFKKDFAPTYWGMVDDGPPQHTNVLPKVPGGLLRTVDNGVGLTTSFEYSTVQNLDRSQWTHQSQAVQPVVTRISVAQAAPAQIENVTTYTYGNPAFDPWQQRLTGFDKVTARDLGRDRYTETQYHISACNFDTAITTCPQTSEVDFEQAVSGRPLQVATWTMINGQRVEIGHTVYHYQNKPLYQQTAGGKMVWFAYVDQIDHHIPYQVGGAPFVISQQVITTLGELQSSVVVNVVVPEAGDLVRWTRTIDDFGNTTKSTAHGRVYLQGGQIDTPIVTDSVYGRDTGERPWAFNITDQTVSDGGGTPERTLHYEYAPSSRDLRWMDMKLEGTGYINRAHSGGGAVAPLPAGASSDGWKRIAAFEYGIFGNVERAYGTYRDTVTGLKSPCIDYLYDDDYKNFPVETKVYRDGCGSSNPIKSNALYHRGFGDLLRNLSANFEASSVEYDAFGRVAETHGPAVAIPSLTDPEADAKFFYSDTGAVRNVEQQHRTSPGVFHRSFAEVNGRGEVIAEWQQGDSVAGGSPWYVSVLKQDANGRVVGQYNPIGTSNNPTLKQGYSLALGTPQRTTQLDAFDRPLNARIDGVEVHRREYLGLMQRDYVEGHVDPASPYGNNPIFTIRDGHGHLVYKHETVDPGTGEYRYTTWGYTPSGHLSAMSEMSSLGAQNAKGFFYDSFGRMTLSVDWDASDGTRHWAYAYNDAGELVATSDPRGCGANFHYDAMGRIVAKDVSPCTDQQPVYTAPNFSTGDGTEAFYRYDAPDPGAPSSDYGTAVSFLGKLMSVQDRGVHTRYAYDSRARNIQVARRVAKPGVADATLATRYSNHWFRAAAEYDSADRVVARGTGADIPELLDGGGLSRITYSYSDQGDVQQIDGSYGTLWSLTSRTAEGLVRQTRFGDLAQTTETVDYDTRFRLATRKVDRAAQALWDQNGHAFYTKPPAGATYRQTVLADEIYTYDSASNPHKIEDKRIDAEWDTGYKPATRTYGYDALFRIASVSTGYTHAGNANDTHKNPYLPEQTANDTRPAPRRTATNRPRTQTFTHDWRDNLMSSTDDANLFWDRSTSTASLGNVQGWQLDRLNSIGSGNDEATIVYDEQGNMSEVRVKRTGTCPVGGCFQAYAYSWNEEGKLARARRWDSTTFAGLNTGGTPAWDVTYEYDSGGQRVLKSSSDDANNTSHTLEVLDTLRLNRTTYDAGTNDYVRSAATETVYAGGVARIFSAPGLPSTTNSDLHVYLMLADHLGSTSIVIDKATSEVVETSMHDPYGRLESDYRPTRWQTFREDYKFTGKEEDAEVGLVYFGARYYSPNLSRFISPDPLTVMAGMAGPNPYAYVNGQVTTSTDPWGLDGTQAHAANDFPHDSNDTVNTIVNSPPVSVGAPIAEGSPASTSSNLGELSGLLASAVQAYHYSRAGAGDNLFSKIHGTLVHSIPGTEYTFRPDRVNAIIFNDMVSALAGGAAGGDLSRALATNGKYAGAFGVPPSSDPKHDISDVIARVGPILISVFAEAGLAASRMVAALRTGALANNLRFAQTTASPSFSDAGLFRGQTIGSVAAKLRSGAMSAKQVPIKYVNIGGNKLIVNTRSALALMRSGIPRSSWTLIDATAEDAGHIQTRLLNNGLAAQGSSTLRITGVGAKASSLR